MDIPWVEPEYFAMSVLEDEPWWRRLWVQPHCTCTSITCSVVVQTLARLLEVPIAPICQREACFCQVLPVDGAAAQLLALRLVPGSLNGQQVDVAR